MFYDDRNIKHWFLCVPCFCLRYLCLLLGYTVLSFGGHALYPKVCLSCSQNWTWACRWKGSKMQTVLWSLGSCPHVSSQGYLTSCGNTGVLIIASVPCIIWRCFWCDNSSAGRLCWSVNIFLHWCLLNVLVLLDERELLKLPATRFGIFVSFFISHMTTM